MALETRFDTKIAVLVRDDLATWQRLNMTAFLVSGIAHAWPQLVGEPYADADGTAYLPMLGQPVLVFEADAATLKAAHERALRRDLTVGVFTADLFRTRNDEDNRATVAATHSSGWWSEVTSKPRSAAMRAPPR